MFQWTSNVNSLWSAKPIKSRFTLRMTGIESRHFHLAIKNCWERIEQDMMLNSPTALVRITDNGGLLAFWSQPGYAQRILFVNCANQCALGTIEVTGMGAVVVNSCRGQNLNEEWPVLWKSQMVMVVGVEAGVEMKLTDSIAKTTGSIRYSGGHFRWYVPECFREPSKQHDLPEIEKTKLEEQLATGSDDGRSETASVVSIERAGEATGMLVRGRIEGTVAGIEWLPTNQPIPSYAHRMPNGRPYVHTTGFCPHCMFAPGATYTVPTD